MNVIAENTSVSVIKVLFVTDVVLKLQKKKYVVKVWDISHWWFLLLISGISNHFLIKLDIFLVCQLKNLTDYLL